jgi:hypothetical protein
MRAGSLARGKPISLEARPWRAVCSVVRAWTKEAHEGKSGESRSKSSEGESPGGCEAQESYVLVAGLNSQWRVADFRVEQSPEGGGAPGPVSETV